MVKKYLLKIILLCSVTLFFNKASAQYAVTGKADTSLVHSVYWLTWGAVNPNYNGDISTLPTNRSTLIYASNPAYSVGSNNTATSVVNGDYTWQFSPTVQIRASITALSIVDNGGAPTTGTMSGYTAGGQPEDGLDDLFSASLAGGSAVANSSLLTPTGATCTFNISIHLYIKINGVYIDTTYPGMVIADGETIFGEQHQPNDPFPTVPIESFGADTPNPIGMQLIAKNFTFNNGAGPTGAGLVKTRYYKMQLSQAGKRFKVFLDTTRNGDYGTCSVFFGHNTNVLNNVTMRGRGNTGIALGFIVPFDLGDNPRSYGFTGNYIDQFVINDNTIVRDTTISVYDAAVTKLVPKPTVFMGNNSANLPPNFSGTTDVDPDGPLLGDSTSSIDDNNGKKINNVIINDENTLVRPTSLKVNQDSSLVLKIPYVTNTKLNGGNIYCWVDLNGNGFFESSEMIKDTVAASSSNISHTFTYSNAQFKASAKVGPLFARFRVTTSILKDSLASAVDERALSFAADGETEDYRLDVTGITISGNVYDDGNGGNDGVIGGVGTTAIQKVGTSQAQLYAYLANGAGTIQNKATVASDGSYVFNNADNSSNSNVGTYTVAISTANVATSTLLSALPANGGLPTGYVPSGASYGINNVGRASNSVQTGSIPNLQIFVNTPYSNLNVTGVNFGIDAAPIAINDPGNSVGPSNTVVIDAPANDTDGDGTLDKTTVLLIDPNGGQKKTTVTTSAGTYTVNTTTGKVSFTAASNFAANTSITYTIKDNFGAESAPATISITYSPGPGGTSDNATTTIGNPVTTDVRNNDSDPTGTVTVTGTSTNGGTTTVNSSNQQVTYAPATGFTGKDIYTYTLTNNTGTSSPINVTVNVKPVGVADTASVAAGSNTPVNVPVITNDGPSGSNTGTTVTNLTTPTKGGAVTLGPNNTVNYTPPAAIGNNSPYAGLDTFTYTLTTADNVSSNPITVTVSVKPVGASDAITTTINVTGNPQTIITNDASKNVSGIIVSPVATATSRGGTVSTGPNNTILYTALNNYVGVDSYNYKLTTSDGVNSNPIAVAVRIKPVGKADTIGVAPGNLVKIPVLANDGPSGKVGGIILSKASDPTKGTVALNADSTFNYTANANASGTDTFKYLLTSSVSSGSVASDSVTVTININSNGVEDAYTTTINTKVPSYNVKRNDGTSYTNATVALTTSASATTAKSTRNGDITVNQQDQTVSYTPPTNSVGIDTYYYTLTNSGSSPTPPIKTTVTIKPVGKSDTTSVISGGTINIPVLANDGPSGKVAGIILSKASNPTKGTVTLNADSTFKYVANSNTSGTDSFKYLLTSSQSTGSIASDSITVYINISAITQAGQPDVYSTPINTPVTYDVRNNDGSSFANATVTPQSTSTAKGGTVVSDLANKVIYTPPTNFIGKDTYTYTLTNSGGSPTAAIIDTVKVLPVGVNDFYSTTPGVYLLNTVKDNDGASANGTTVAVDLVSPAHGSLTLVNSSTAFLYTPTNSTYSGPDTYTYTLTTTDGIKSAPITVVINIVPASTTTGNDDNDVTKINTPKVTIVKANDGPTFANATVTPSATSTKNGIVTNDGNGNLIYTPPTNFIGKDTYTYTLTNTGGTPTAAITVNMAVKPVGMHDIYSTGVGVAILNSVKDNDGASAIGTTVAVVTQPAHGTATPNTANTVFTYTPVAGYVGTDTYTYTLTTADGVVSDPITVIINIANANPSGTLSTGGTPDMDVTLMGVAKTTNVRANDGASNATATVTPQSAVTTNGGKVVLASDGSSITYTPVSGFVGKDTYNYTLSTSTSPIPVTINVRPIGMNDSYSTILNTPVPNKVKDNDGSNVAGTSFTVKLVTPPSYGTALPADNTNTSFIYTPANNFTGTDSYTYAIITPDGIYSAPITVINTVNTAANTGKNDAYTTLINTPIDYDVKANDPATFANATVTPTSATTTKGGTVVNDGANKIIYTPPVNFIGRDGYTYTLTNSGSNPTPAINVVVGVLPVGVNDIYSTAAGVAVINTVKDNDGASGNGTTLSVGAIQPTHGTVAVTPGNANTFTYTPNDNVYTGTDTYTYILTTTDNVPSAPITVLINIVAPGTTTGNPDADVTKINTPKVTVVKANDGPVFTNAVVTPSPSVKGGTVVNDGSGNLIYTPPTGFIGKDNYTYTLANPGGTPTASIPVVIAVKPVGVRDIYSTSVGVAIPNSVKDNDGASAVNTTVAVATPPSNGTVTPNTANTAFTYSPAAGYVGTDTYTYTLTTTDGVVSDPITVVINIANAGTNGTLSTGGTPDMDLTFIGIAKTTNVKANDGSNNTNATVIPQSGVTTKGGSVSLATDGSGNIVYNPLSTFTGVDTYTYTLNNGSTTTSPIAVTIQVRPVGVNDIYSTSINTVVNNPVLSNDGASGTTASGNKAVIVSQPAYGTVAANGTTAFTYTPPNGFTGTDTYTYAIVTPDGVYSAPVTVTVSVVPPSSLTLTKIANNGASAAGDVISYTLTVSNKSTTAVTNVKVTDTGADAGSITPANIAILAAGASATVTAKHTVTAADVAAGSYSNQASVTATDINGNPVSKPKSDNPATTAVDDPTVVQIGGISLVKTGVSDYTSATFTFVITNTGLLPLTNISLTDPLLNITNSPITVAGGLAPGAKTTVTFKYTLLQADRDAEKVINSATVNATDPNNNLFTNTSTVTVAVPPSPKTIPETVTTQVGSTITFSPSKNDVTSGAAFVAIEILQQPKHGKLIINADLSVTYIPDPGYNGPDSFIYRLRDVNGFYTNASAVAINDGFVNNLKIPNTFTPNGDGVNDTFEIIGIENYPINELIIVNRWGNEVYHKTNYTKEWTGEGLNEGTYYFLLHLKGPDGGDIEVIKGYVSLIRNRVN